LAACLTRALRLAASAGADSHEILPANSVLPVRLQLAASLPANQAKGYLQLYAAAAEACDAATHLGELVFELAERSNAAGDEHLTIVVAVSEEGEITVEVAQTATSLVVATLTVPASA
jgi:hypothetical protein